MSNPVLSAVAGIDTRLRGWLAPGVARALAVVAAVALIVSSFFNWTYDSAFAGDLTITGYPGGVQVYTDALAVLALLTVALETSPLRRARAAVAPRGLGGALRGLASAALIVVLLIDALITVQLGGLVNVAPGAWLALVASVALVAAARALPDDGRTASGPSMARPSRLPATRQVPAWAEILAIGVVLVLVLGATVHALDIPDPQTFAGFLVLVSGIVLAANRAGLSARFSATVARHRQVTAVGAFAVALAFPFTQGGNNYWMTVGANLGIFATVAIGLNIVVGLAGLLDLGYVAFLGVGAYVGALLSGSAASALGWHPPFLVSFLLGAAMSALFGMVIGAPTLRLRGDYLAIVTLGFGEIFRITVNNLSGSNGPNWTGGPNGIPGIPNLSLFGYDFGKGPTILGVQMGYFANYYFLELLVMAFVVTVFVRANNSRIGRAWVAIREDETAASAMGVNTFRFKLLAFALGASLAGMIGTVQAHVASSVTPDSYQFLNSAFLLAAVILGGMGSVQGSLLGSALLILIPEKFRFFADKQLLLFGLALVLMMRYRPEGLIANRRRQREMHERHEEDALDAPPESPVAHMTPVERL